MRENRLYGSEGGGIELNRSSLPLFPIARSGAAAWFPVARAGLRLPPSWHSVYFEWLDFCRISCGAVCRCRDTLINRRSLVCATRRVIVARGSLTLIMVACVAALGARCSALETQEQPDGQTSAAASSSPARLAEEREMIRLLADTLEQVRANYVDAQSASAS